MSSNDGMYVMRFAEGDKEVFSVKYVSAIDNLFYHVDAARDKYVEEMWGTGK